MAYVKNTWVDQNVSRPKTYEVTTNQDGTITLTDSFGVITELGTPVNEVNMNHIEDGIEGCAIRKHNLTETFNLGEWVLGGTGNAKGIYESLIANNVNNAITDNAKWAKVDTSNLPDQTGHTGDVLTTDGTDASWADTGEIYPVVEKYSNGASWYRVYSDGWCEQGSLYYKGSTIAGDNTIDFLKQFSDTNYNLMITLVYSNTSSSGYGWFEKYPSRTVASATFYTPNQWFGYEWRACGYIGTNNTDRYYAVKS